MLKTSGASDDGNIDLAVASVDAFVKRVTGRAWGEDVTVTDEDHDYNSVIFLDSMAVKSITSVKIGYGDSYTLLASDDYRWNSYGRLLLSFEEDNTYSTYDFDEVRVSYIYGEDDTPGDLKMAALALAAIQFEESKSQGRQVKIEEVGTRKIEYGDSSTDTVSAIDTINSYRRIRF